MLSKEKRLGVRLYRLSNDATKSPSKKNWKVMSCPSLLKTGAGNLSGSRTTCPLSCLLPVISFWEEQITRLSPEAIENRRFYQSSLLFHLYSSWFVISLAKIIFRMYIITIVYYKTCDLKDRYAMESKDYPDGQSLFFLLFQQFFASVTLQYFHLLNGYLIEFNQPLTLRNTLVYKYCIEVFHI